MSDLDTVLPIESLTFLTSSNAFSTEYLQEWLFFLAEKNTQDMKEDLEFKDYLSTPKIVKMIFKFCKKIKGPTEVRYASVEMFDRFLFKHLREMHDEVYNNTKRSIRWDDVEQRLKGQLMLRVLSCVQLASKLHSHNNSLTSANARDILKLAGETFTLKNILSSELRVLRTLDYQLTVPTPLTYVETLLEIVAYNTKTFRPSDVYPTIVQLTDFFYLNRERIYVRVYRICVGERDSGNLQSPRYKKEYHCLKSDYLILGVALIYTAAGFISTELQATVGEELQMITAINVEDFRDYSDALLAEIGCD